MCHNLEQDPKFFRFLIRIDRELSELARRKGCPCGGVLHRANFPRKPRGCPLAYRTEFESRLSFCCAHCRKRTTPRSVRFLGRRLYLSWVMLLVSARHAKRQTSTNALATAVNVSSRTINRWRIWWQRDFVDSAFWQIQQALFIPHVSTNRLPASLLERFDRSSGQALRRALIFLAPITLHEGG